MEARRRRGAESNGRMRARPGECNRKRTRRVGDNAPHHCDPVRSKVGRLVLKPPFV